MCVSSNGLELHCHGSGFDERTYNEKAFRIKQWCDIQQFFIESLSYLSYKSDCVNVWC